MDELSWLGIMRHGESVGNRAADQAEAAGVETLDIATSDADTPLSEIGRRQARHAGQWVDTLPSGQQPSLIVSSTYLRAAQTARSFCSHMNAPPPLMFDERLRDRELGILDGLTSRGVTARHPDEIARRRRLGKFYYRPPSGESWADVALRLRLFLSDLRGSYPRERVLLVSHEAPVLLMRYLIEDLTVAELLALAGRRLANASLTSWELSDGQLQLEAFGTDIAAESGVRSTRQTHV